MDVLFDVDGTLADCTHRLPHILSNPKDWKTFNSLLHKDRPFDGIREVCNALYHAGNFVLLCTGREETLRAQTEDWLIEHGVYYHELYMRPRSDFRDDHIVKADLLEQIHSEGWLPQLAFEDRARVVEMWRAKGLICCQVAKGDF